MSSSLQRIFTINRPLVFFAYGLVFFVLGLAILLQSRQHSRLLLARNLHWLALFGLSHGFYEWGDVFIPLQLAYLAAPFVQLLRVGQVGLLAVSFTCLFQFGIDLFRPLPQTWTWLRWTPAGVLLIWLLVTFAGLMNLAISLPMWLTYATIGARYLIGCPAAFLAAYGLRYQTAQLIAPFHEPRILRMLKLAGLSLTGYGFLAGLLVPPALFFPANWLNTALSEQLIGIPVPIFRSGVGLILAIAIIRALEIFDVEMDRKLATLEEVQILTTERERIGRDLHDRTLQSIYAVGLLLKAMHPQLRLSEHEELRQRIGQAEQILDQAITEMRQHISELRTHPTSLNLADGLTQLLRESALSSLAEVELTLDLPTDQPFPQRQVRHVLAIAGEALSNIARHAQAHHVQLCAYLTTGHLCLIISDDGVGIPVDYVAGYGLRNMNERARLLGGELTVASTPGHGVRLHLVAPWETTP